MLREVLREAQGQPNCRTGTEHRSRRQPCDVRHRQECLRTDRGRAGNVEPVVPGLTNLDIAKARQCRKAPSKPICTRSIASSAWPIVAGDAGGATSGRSARDRQAARRAASFRCAIWLLPHMKPESKRQGELLFRKGDPGQTMYFIQKGRVALPEIGVEMSDGELFGEIGIFTPSSAHLHGALRNRCASCSRSPQIRPSACSSRIRSSPITSPG